MANISRIQAVFTGAGVVGPASASMYTTGQVINARVPWFQLWNALANYMPSSVTITIPNTGETYDDATGDLVEIWTSGTTSTVNGAGSGSFAKGVGARIIWNTAGTTNNRRVRGSTFVVPLSGASYDTDGTLTATVAAALASNASTFVAATQSDFVIWTRPRPGVTGKSSGVLGSAAPDTISTLRSRRT